MPSRARALVRRLIDSRLAARLLPDHYLRSPVQGLKIVSKDDAHIWVGYYDLEVVSKDEQFIVYHELSHGCKHVKIGIVDLSTEALIEISESACWSYQFGARAQFSPLGRLCYLKRINGRIGYAEVDLSNRNEEILHPDVQLYAFSPCGRYKVEIDYDKIFSHRPGYGIRCPVGAQSTRRALGVHSTEDQKLESEILDSDLPAMAAKAWGGNEKHYRVEELHLNTPRFSPDGRHLGFLLVWEGTTRRQALVCTNTAKGGYTFCELDFASHFCWRDEFNILVTGRDIGGSNGYFNWSLSQAKITGALSDWPAQDGHPSLHANISHLAITDTYPNKLNYQKLYLHQGGRRKFIAALSSPMGRGDDKCDLHPRWFPQSSRVAIDTSFGGRRSIGILDIVPKQ